MIEHNIKDYLYPGFMHFFDQFFKFIDLTTFRGLGCIGSFGSKKS